DNSFVLTIIDKSFSMLLFTLPPGGFMILGFVIAFKNFIDIYFNDYILSNFSICSCVKFKKKY
ncbi:electron transport complex subunit RsxE, partial [Buchnera aphidicola]|nr:electron transport complex subunit RsxE [Buchnera aphidicola]